MQKKSSELIYSKSYPKNSIIGISTKSHHIHLPNEACLKIAFNLNPLFSIQSIAILKTQEWFHSARLELKMPIKSILPGKLQFPNFLELDK